MARMILGVFGSISIGLGIFVLVMTGLGAAGASGAWTGLGFGSSLLIAGSSLLGFAQIIHLLEQIAANTRPASTVALHDPMAWNLPKVEG